MRSLPALAARADSVAYAECLYRYAAPRLDPFSLRCWIIQRLMLDNGIEHQRAAEVAEYVLSKEREMACARETRRISTQRRHGPLATTKRRIRSGRLVRPRASPHA